MARFGIPPWLHRPATNYLPRAPCKVQATAQMRRLRSPVLVQLPLLRPQTGSSNSWKDWGFVWLSRPKVLGKLIFVWPQCRAMGPRKGIVGYHWIKTRHNGQTTLCFHERNTLWVAIVVVNSWRLLEDAPLDGWWFGFMDCKYKSGEVEEKSSVDALGKCII